MTRVGVRGNCFCFGLSPFTSADTLFLNLDCVRSSEDLAES
jgi:hypothetical protein